MLFENRISNNTKSEFFNEVVEYISYELEYADNIQVSLAVNLIQLRDHLTDSGQSYEYAMELTAKVANYFCDAIRNEDDLNDFWCILDGICWTYEDGELIEL